MALPTGLAGQVGYVSEVTPGTAVTVTRFLPFTGESLSGNPERLDNDAIIAGKQMESSGQWQAGNMSAEGTIEHQIYTTGIGLLLKHCFGAVATSGAGPYVHTFTPASALAASMTVQVGVPGVGGTVATKTMVGSKVKGWEMKVAAGELSTFAIDLVGMNITYAVALATASFPAGGGIPFVGHNVAVTVGGSAVNCKEITIKGENPLAERRFLGSQYQLEPLGNAYREITGTMVLEFIDMTQYNRVVNATEAAVVVTMTAGAQILAITMNCRFDGETPVVGGTDIVEQPLNFKAIATGADSTAITAVYTTTDATPT